MLVAAPVSESAAITTAPPSAGDLEPYRTELTAYCYRMLGSGFEAEDAVQDTMVRAWRSLDRFEGRASLRTWLYRIATNVCLDMLDGRQRRARPMDLGPATSGATHPGPARSEATWVEPMPDDRVVPDDGDPAELAVARDSVRLAFIGALQFLPARQRAVLILREVLRWKATEVATLLDTSVASVNSALQRARATLAARDLAADGSAPAPERMDADTEALLARYLDAFERYDVDALAALLHDDAVMTMPPFALWLRGPAEIRRWFTGPGAECEGSRLVPIRANGAPGFAQYRPSGPGGRHEPWALQVLDLRDNQVSGFHAFLDAARLYPLFGLPAHPDQA